MKPRQAHGDQGAHAAGLGDVQSHGQKSNGGHLKQEARDIQGLPQAVSAQRQLTEEVEGVGDGDHDAEKEGEDEGDEGDVTFHGDSFRADMRGGH